MAEIKTVPEWAKIDNIPVRTAQRARERAGVGTLIGRGYGLTRKEWETLKKDNRWENKEKKQ